MSQISLPRFGRLMLNDMLRVARPALYTTVTLLAVTVLLYLIRFNRVGSSRVYTDFVVFGCCLFTAGLYLTGVAFRDMHHPLERYQYLMLPVSNPERLLSRYLLTGPLLVVCAVPAFVAFDFLANVATEMWIDKRSSLFSPFTVQTKWIVVSYMFTHMVMFVGAICFRSYALLKTSMFIVLVFFGLLIVENVAERIFFPEYYSWTQFGSVREFPLELLPWFAASWMNVAFVIGVVAWLLWIAYLCLRDHEAADGV